MGDRRGFRYELEPVQRKCEWELNDMTMELAALNRRVADEEHRLEVLAGELRDVRGGWARQIQQGRVNLEMHRLTNSYLGQLQHRISDQQEGIRGLEQHRTQAIQRSHALRKFSENIERNRDEAMANHEKNMAERAFKDADDMWLQRMHWKEEQ